MKITVELNENPSTGYVWEATVLPVANEFVSNVPVGEFRVGAGGTRILTFEDVRDAITINLRRPWIRDEDEPPVEVVTILHHSRR